MNYAQDALWWRITHPTVRDLASLLTAPSLWHSSNELPVRTLLGEQGFRYLIELNDCPEKLPENLVATHLGHYAENLLAFWFAHAPHSQLIAQEVLVYEKQQTQGALDFIVSLSGSLYHIELTCKYYGAAQGQPENMIGLNPRDTLLNKREKLIQQSALSHNENATKSLAKYLTPPKNIQRATIIRGIGFTHSGSLPENSIYPPNAWSGLLIENSEQWQVFAQDSRFYRMERTQYLAPARVQYEQTINLNEAMQQHGCLLAQVAPRPDGYWHEQQRLMLPETPFSA